VLHSRSYSIVDAHVYNHSTNCSHASLLPHRSTELTEGVPSAIVQHLMHADQQVRGQEANLITLRPATMEIVPGGEFQDGARGIQLRVRSWPQGNLSAMPHVKWEWLVAPGEWVCASELTRITAQNRGLPCDAQAAIENSDVLESLRKSDKQIKVGGIDYELDEDFVLRGNGPLSGDNATRLLLVTNRRGGLSCVRSCRKLYPLCLGFRAQTISSDGARLARLSRTTRWTRTTTSTKRQRSATTHNTRQASARSMPQSPSAD
jgi:hypothetical protein